MAMSKAQQKNKAAKHAKTWHSIKTLLGITTFVEQITSKDRASYSNLPMMQKAQAALNNLTGNMFGINLFNGVPKFNQKINPAGMANKWTGLGIGGIIYQIASRYSPVKLPHAGKVGGIGKILLASGIFGGLFDDPPGQGYTPSSGITNVSQNFVSQSGQFAPNYPIPARGLSSN